MPWSADDARSHNKKADTPAKQTAWAKAANAALEKYGDEGKALATANAAIADMDDDEHRARAFPFKKKKPDEEEAPPADDAAEETDEPVDDPEEEAAEEEVAAGEEKDDALAKKKKKEFFPPRSATDSNLRFRDMGNAGVMLKVKPNSYDQETRTADVMISTGAAVRRRAGGFFDDPEEFDEILDMKPASIRLERLNAGAQFIDSHQYHRGLDAVLGALVPGSAHIKGKELLGKLKLSRSERGDRIARDLIDGITVPVSIGYRTHKETVDRSTSPITRTAVDWEPYEVSYAPIPHEAGAAVRAELDDRGFGRTPPKETEMDIAEKKRAADEAREYALDMLKLGRDAGFKDDVIDEAIRTAEPIDKFRARVVTHLVAKSKERPTSPTNGNDESESSIATRFDPHTGRFSVGMDREKHQLVEAMSEAATIRMLSSRRVPAILSEGQAEWVKRMGRVDQIARSWRVFDGKEEPTYKRTKEFMGMSLTEMAAVCCGYRGSLRTTQEHWAIFQRAMQSTAEYPSIFENVLNKSLLARYSIAAPSYRELAIERQFNDFRPHPQVRAGEFPMLEPLTETGEIRYGVSQEGKETIAVAPYAKAWSISRQSIVNDEMGAIDEMLGTAGQMVLQFENITFYAMFNSNPVLKTDSLAVFEAAVHKNLDATGVEPNIAAIGRARKALRDMKSLSGLPLNVESAVILTGSAHETRVDQLTSSISPVVYGGVNPFSGKLKHVTDAAITGNEWYVFASPSALPCFVYGFLQGASGPRVTTDEPFDRQGVRTKIEHDFGVGAIDYRGVFKDGGAVPSEVDFSVINVT